MKQKKKFLLTAVLICSLVLSLGMSALALENDAAAPATDLQIGNNTEELSGDENSSAAGSDLTSEQTKTDSKEKKKIAASNNSVPPKAASPKAESTVTIDSIDYEADAGSGTATVTGGEPTDGVLHIPAEITTGGATYRVTAIAEKAFMNYSGDEYTLSLSEGLESVGAYAFDWAFIQGTLTIPDSVTYIGEGAFNGGSYTKIIIGDGLKEIPSGAFEYPNYSIEEVVIGKSVEKIDKNAFRGCKIEKVTVYSTSEALRASIKELEGLKNATIVYIDSEGKDGQWLQEQIDNAPEQEQTVIVIDDRVVLDETVVIPSDKDIVLTDDGTARTILAGPNLSSLFEIKYGGALTVRSSDGTDDLLVLEGNPAEEMDAGSVATVRGKFVLESGTLRGGKLRIDRTGAVFAEGKAAQFIMSGGVIENTYLGNGESLALLGAVVISDGAHFEMSGGSIRDNDIISTGQYSGGGVILVGWSPSDPVATMNLSGSAEISDNSSYFGGGIHIVGNAHLNMSGGKVSDNFASSHGGGICVAGKSGGGASDCGFTMTGGTISGNFSGGSGGGIYLNSDQVVLSAGRIENNEASVHGGGIYVSQPPYELQLENALITENTASVMGGGMWFCPTGDATAYVTNGCAIFDNKAENTEGLASAGDDFVSVGGYSGCATIPDRVLGGGAVKWYRDGGVYAKITIPPQSVIGEVLPDVPRFDPKDPGEPIRMVESNEAFALKAVVSEEAKALAKSRAKLYITGNKAMHGGGLGSNGAATVGKNEDYKLIVKKQWSDDTPEEAKTEVTVYLKVGDYRLDDVKLNEENGWQAEFSQLPAPDSLGDLQYAVVEDPVPANFTPVYRDAVIDDETKTIYIEVENQYMEPAFGNLTVSKTVLGNAADYGKSFSFTVTLSDTSVNGTYGDMTFVDGVAAFQLKHEEQKTASGLPAGITYRVEETEANRDGYTTTASGSEGVIEKDKTQTAAFRNAKSSAPIPSTGILEVTKTVAGNAADYSRSFGFTVTLSDTSVNGTYGDMTFVNGTASFRLKHGESKRAYGLPAGVSYQVVETEANQDGYETAVTGDKGIIKSYAASTAAFVNTKNEAPQEETGSLTVSKTVSGSAGDKEKSFLFTVTLSDETINGTYGDMTFTDGVAVFSLKHGEHKTALGLPAGLTYRVSEKEANRNGYVTKTSGADGSIRADETASAAFVNSKDELPVPPGPSDDVPENPNQPDDGDVPVHSGADAPKTGDSANPSLWVVLLGISVVGLLGTVYCFRRQQRK